MFKKLFKIGITSELSGNLRVKVILSNQISLIMACVEMVYAVLSKLYFPVLFPLFLSGLIFVIVVFWLNYVRYYNASRFIVATFPTLISGFTYMALSQGNDDVLLEIAFVAYSMMICPFMMFDGKEKLLRNVSFLICALPILCYKFINEWVDIKIDASAVKTDVFTIFNLGLSILVMFAFLAVLQITSQKAEEKNNQLLQSMEENNRETAGKSVALEETLKEVEKARIEDEKRGWAATGIAQMSVIMREEDNLEKLYDRIISGIVKYLNANQGSLFLIKGDEISKKHIELVACYAYDKKKFIEKSIPIGHGLIGQCCMEKKRIFLTNVPDSYVKITSGMGESNPRCIVIIPMIANDEVEGLIEIASFRVLEEFEIDFLEKLGENLASVLRNNNINSQTKYLLEETRQQAEEMKAQEEEMRQNMEELQATQEEMERKEREYIQQIAELEEELNVIKKMS